MANRFSIDDILGEQSRVTVPAERLVVSWIPIDQIKPDPRNTIYEIGDISMLKADMADNGIRQPLEVVVEEEGWRIRSGHRRWTAAKALRDEGDGRFINIPCVICQSRGEDDDVIGLIMANATARDMTDAEKLRQYSALKQALEHKKAAGDLHGRVRDEIVRITGDSSGKLARYNAILSHCCPEVLTMIDRGEIGLTRAYEASKLYKVQQVGFVKNGYAAMPDATPEQVQAACDYIVGEVYKDAMQAFDYRLGVQGFIKHCTKQCEGFEPASVQMKDGSCIEVSQGRYLEQFVAKVPVPGDPGEYMAASTFYIGKVFSTAKRMYGNTASPGGTEPVQAVVKVREVPREEPEEVDAPGGTSEETVSTEDETIALSRAEACSVLKEFYKEHAGYTWSARCCAAIKVAIDVLDGTPGITEGDAE